jgi:hypothetical protein
MPLKSTVPFLESVGIFEPNRSIGNFMLFHVGPKLRNCTTARSASAVNAIGRVSGEFHGRSALIHHVLD